MSKHTSEKSKKRDMTVVIALVCALVLAAVIFVIASRGTSDGTEGTTDPAAAQTEGSSTVGDSAESTGTIDETTDVTSDSESSDVTVTEVPITTNPPFVPDTDYDYRGVAQGEENELSVLSKSVFIGDSRTEGLRLYTSLTSTGARVYAGVGMMVNNVLTKDIVDQGGKKVTLTEALGSDTDFDSVYIMLGINELGWVYTQTYIDAYADIIDAVRAVNPAAKIYVQSLIPVTKELSDRDPVFTNTRIEEYNKALSSLAASKGVLYLNVAEIFSADGGALPADAANDGVHLKKAYCDMWLGYILNHRA